MPASAMPEIAEAYVRLALAVGRHDPNYVDAYYGPPEWKAAADSVTVPLDTLAAHVDAVRKRLTETAIPAAADALDSLRHTYLDRQLSAMAARLQMLQGKKLRFDEESEALYNAVAPTHPESYLQDLIAKLDPLLPGTGSVADRYRAFRSEFIVPAAKVDTVFKTAIAECRARTIKYVSLPANESFTVEYVKNKPWSGYNWYQGGSKSLIQVNIDLPIYIDRAIDLACHEGYPGHHVYNALLESALVRGKGWTEFSIYPLFSPQSLIAEGTANYGIVMAFPGGERAAFERDHLYPLAGLDPALAERYARIQEVAGELSYAGNEAARRYLDGEIDAKAAADWLVRYALSTPEAAIQRVKFFDTYRSYVINYNLGRDLVGTYVDREAGAGAPAERRWQVFSGLLASPRLPGGLQER
ncbi:MAG: hypothetical protein ABI647_13910 [Gemmatimonadota bacterium]